MDLKLGSKNGKQNRRLFFLNRKRKLDKEMEEKKENKKKEEELKFKKKDQILLNRNNNIFNSIEKLEKHSNNYHVSPIMFNRKRVGKSREENEVFEEKKSPTVIDELAVDTINIEKEVTIHEVNTKLNEQNVKTVTPLNENVVFEEKTEVSKDNIYTEKQTPIAVHKKLDEEIEILEDTVTMPIGRTLFTEKEINVKDTEHLEKKLFNIVYDILDENRYQLKKIDKELSDIEKEIDFIDNHNDLKVSEQEIEILDMKIKYIKRQIDSLQKTFESKLNIEINDNYLLGLIDDLKEEINFKEYFDENIKDKQFYKDIINEITIVEKKQENLVEKIETKKSKLEIDNEKIDKINNEIEEIEYTKRMIERMLDIQTNLLKDIEIRLNETVHISEKVDYITKTMNHSIFELLLLMTIFKQNIGIKNNVMAALTAKFALDLIMKMTTPTSEKVITKVSDVKDYSELIIDCFNDTEKLQKVIHENLNNISSIIYTFENDYKEYSYLPNYQETLKKVLILESEMKEKMVSVNKMKEEVEIQLDENNDKIRKYGLMTK